MADVLKELGNQVLNDVVNGKLKRKKLMKKKTFKGFMVALKMFVDDFDKLRTDYEILQTLVDKCENTNNKLIEENCELLAVIREYQRRITPDFYPEETKEEAEMLEDLSDDYPFTDAEIQERIDAENAEYVAEEKSNE